MKKLLAVVTLGFFLCSNSYAYKSIKILDKIDLTIDADPKKVLTSIRNYNNNATCEVSIVKEGDHAPTTVRFSLSDNLNEFYNFFRTYKKPISISCLKFKYKFKDRNDSYDIWDEEIILRFSLCKNRVTEIETIAYLNTQIYGENPMILKKWVSLFKNYSVESPRKEVKEYGERNVWVDKIFKDNKSEIQFSIIQGIHSDGLGSYKVRLIDLVKFSRCYLF